MRITATALMTVLLASASGCSDGGPNPGDAVATLDRDVALFAADAAGQDIEVMRGPPGRFGLGLGADPAHFDCGTVARDGITLTRTCEFFDAAGAPQAAYDPTDTDSVFMHVEMRGTIDRGEWSATVDRVRDIAVSGLAGQETQLTWNGSGSGTMSRIRQTRDGGEVQLDMSGTQRVTNVIVPVPRTEDGWPLGGTVTSTVTVSITGGLHDGESHTRDVTIVFDGSQYAQVTLNGETFTVNLADRSHAPRHHRPGSRH